MLVKVYFVSVSFDAAKSVGDCFSWLLPELAAVASAVRIKSKLASSMLWARPYKRATASGVNIGAMLLIIEGSGVLSSAN